MNRFTVSCIMCTKDRPTFVKKSIKMFEKQSYPNKELIIIDDSDQIDEYAQQCDVKYFHLKGKHSIGKKRNIGIKKASGDVVLIWDDDDYNGPERIKNQLNALLKSKKDAIVYNTCVYYSVPLRVLFTFSKDIHDRIWKYGYIAGTVMFYKYVWNKVKYPSVSFREDILFLERMKDKKMTIGTMKIPKKILCT